MEDEPSYVGTICDFLTKSRKRAQFTRLFFSLLDQYAQSASRRRRSPVEGSLQKLIADQRFLEVLRFTYRSLTENASSLKTKTDLDLKLDEVTDVALNLSLGFSRLINTIANRTGVAAA